MKNNEGKTALIRALGVLKFETIKFLIEKGANVNHTLYGIQTMRQVQFYCMHQNEKIVELSRFLLQTAFFIQYLNNQPVGLKTHILNTNTFERIQPLFNVGDLVAAYKPNSLLANTPLELLTLHLPVGVGRTTLKEECFSSTDTTGTTLDPGCPLSVLGLYGSKNPLIIKSKNDAGKGILIILQ